MSCAVHIACQQIRMRQHPGSFIHLSPLDQTTNDRRTHLLGIDILFLDLRHTEAELVMQSVEQPVISLLVVAEAVVETDSPLRNSRKESG